MEQGESGPTGMLFIQEAVHAGQPDLPKRRAARPAASQKKSRCHPDSLPYGLVQPPPNTRHLPTTLCAWPQARAGRPKAAVSGPLAGRSPPGAVVPLSPQTLASAARLQRLGRRLPAWSCVFLVRSTVPPANSCI